MPFVSVLAVTTKLLVNKFGQYAASIIDCAIGQEVTSMQSLVCR